MSLSDPDSPESASSSRPAFSRVASSYGGIEFVPKRAMRSFENLVALANYEERLREARKVVWRDRGERPAELTDIWECLEHAGRGGLRTSLFMLCVTPTDAQLSLLSGVQGLARLPLPSVLA